MGEPLVDVLAEFCISSLVIICFVKSFHELNIRFFGPAVSRCAASKRSNCDFAIRPVASAGLTFKAFRRGARLREAGTPARSPRFIWRETKPEAPRVRPSGTDTVLLFAARARAHRQHCHVWRSTPALERGGAEQLLCV